MQGMSGYQARFYAKHPKNTLHLANTDMYDLHHSSQISLTDFNNSLGVKLDQKNEWVVVAKKIPWDELELEYAALFKSKEGNVALSFRMMFGASIIKVRTGLGDKKLVQAISENPYYQYFIGLPGYTTKQPFTSPSLTNFRKRCSFDIVNRINDLLVGILEKLPEHEPAAAGKPKKKDGPAGPELTLILDATCSPEDIRFPQDESLLNEAREKLEKMIDRLFFLSGDAVKARTYRELARKEHLRFAKSKKRTEEKTRAAVGKQLRYVLRDIGHVEKYVARGFELDDREKETFEVIERLYEQQKKMYDEHSHRVENRIVSISQPHIRPIVRGKAKAPVEFGPKYDISVDENGFARMEKISFDAYNESSVLQGAVQRYIERTGKAPVRVLVDQIYRTADNIRFCKEKGIRMSGPKMGRPPREADPNALATARRDNTDRIEVERKFSLGKRSYCLSLIRMRLPETEKFAVAMGILVSNLFTTGLARLFLYLLENGTLRPKYIMDGFVLE